MSDYILTKMQERRLKYLQEEKERAEKARQRLEQFDEKYWSVVVPPMEGGIDDEVDEKPEFVRKDDWGWTLV